MYPNPFAPISTGADAGTFNVQPLVISGTTTAQSGTLPGAGGSAYSDIRVENHASDWAYVNFGDSTVAGATSSSIGFAPGSVEIMHVPPNTTTVSVVLGSGTGQVTFSRGLGV